MDTKKVNRIEQNMIPYQLRLLDTYYRIPFENFAYHFNQKQFYRDKLYYKTMGIVEHDRHVIEHDRHVIEHSSKRDIKTAI